MTAGADDPSVLVIIPTHDHASTLDLALGSVLGQSFEQLEVVVVGDGIGPDTREVMAAVSDPRVRLVDVAKTPSRAEGVRHELITATTSDIVCYCGDDDLLLPDHVATMVSLLEDADFAHPLPAPVGPDGAVRALPVQLASPDWLNWHLQPGHNHVSLTGVAHRADAYRRLPVGWAEPPAGVWSDLAMWRRWFSVPGLRYRSGTRATMLKFDASLRHGWTPARRREELLAWAARADTEGFALWFDRLVLDAYARSAADSFLAVEWLVARSTPD